MEEVANKFNLGVGSYDDDGNYVIDLTSKSFGNVFSTLEKAELDQEEQMSVISKHTVSIVYNYNDTYQITLIGNLDNNEYRVVIKEN